MLWALVSTAFVIYLYRKLNATAGTISTDGANSANAFDSELAKLNSRISAIENLVNGKARG
jgi:hypothetical protein